MIPCFEEHQTGRIPAPLFLDPFEEGLSATTTTGSLAPGASVTRILSVTTPSVTSDTIFYYYACVDEPDGSCSPAPATDLAVQMSGAVSGIVEGNRVVSGRILSRITKSDGSILRRYVYDLRGGKQAIPGDSGGPVYTTPDADGNVQIVGALVGALTVAGEKTSTVNAWTDIMKELDLKAIGN